MDKRDVFNGTEKDLIAGFLANEISDEEKQVLYQWVESSEINRRYFEEMKLTWLATGSVDQSQTFNVWKAWRKVSGDDQSKSYSNRKKLSVNLVPDHIKRFTRKSLRIAAILAINFLGGSIFTYTMLRPQMEEKALAAISADATYHLVVPKGSQSHITLPDGSKVSINAGSKLVYTAGYDVSSREIILEGEAYFDVKTNPEKPFIIHTSHLDIKAYGTAFNVKAYPEDPVIVTTLEHGELHIESLSDDDFDMILQPNQNVVYYKAGKEDIVNNALSSGINQTMNTVAAPSSLPAITNDVNTELYTSWKDPEWIIDAETFGDLAVSLERKFNVQILFGSQDLKKYRFSGTIRKETLEQVLNVLAFTAPMRYKIDQGVVQLQIDQMRKRNYDMLSKQ